MPDATRPAAYSGEIVRAGVAATRRVTTSVWLNDTGATSNSATIAEWARRVDGFEQRGPCSARTLYAPAGSTPSARSAGTTDTRRCVMFCTDVSRRCRPADAGRPAHQPRSVGLGHQRLLSFV